MDSRVKDFILTNDDFVLISHISPDGDTLGSSLALFEALRTMGKQAELVSCAAVPESYFFCPGAEKVLLPGDAKPARCAIAIDCGDMGRMGSADALFKAAENTMVIDHHGTNPGFGDVNWVEECGATGELIFLLLEDMGITVTPTIATNLYTAIASDTGNFSYSNTTERSFHIAGELLRSGFDMPRVNRELFRCIPLRKLQLRAALIRESKLYHDDMLVVGCITNAMMDGCHATGADAEGLIDDLRDINTVEVAIVLREEGEDTVRVSMRGKNYFNVAEVAKLFGGGGHKLSAGCTFHCAIEEAEAKVRLATEERL